MRLKNGSKITLADEIDSRQGSALGGIADRNASRYEVGYARGSGPAPWRVFPTAAAGIRADIYFVGPAQVGDGIGRRVFRFPVCNVCSCVAHDLFSSRTKSSRTAAAAPIKPVARRVFSAPLTDADVQRVRTMPAQRGEELLERALGHDPRALELFR